MLASLAAWGPWGQKKAAALAERFVNAAEHGWELPAAVTFTNHGAVVAPKGLKEVVSMLEGAEEKGPRAHNIVFHHCPGVMEMVGATGAKN